MENIIAKTQYSRNFWETQSVIPNGLPIDVYLYARLKQQIDHILFSQNREHLCSWHYEYRGYCDLTTEVCYLEVEYCPDPNIIIFKGDAE